MKKSEFKECDIYAARIVALRPFPKETLKSLREYYRVGLTYTSNALEGNSLESRHRGRTHHRRQTAEGRVRGDRPCEGIRLPL